MPFEKVEHLILTTLSVGLWQFKLSPDLSCHVALADPQRPPLGPAPKRQR